MKSFLTVFLMLSLTGIARAEATSSQFRLSCINGVLSVAKYLGEGPGCGESDTLGIASVTFDNKAKTIAVVSYGIPGKGSNFCHYWGPIHGGGYVPHPLNHLEQSWTVSFDGEAVPGVVLFGTVLEDKKVIPTCKLVR